jgi:hypothetical protein
MQNNDLDNTPSPAVYVVWEGLLATCGQPEKFRRLVRLRRYARALDLYETHGLAVNAMWQAMTRGDYGVSVLTHLPASVADLLAERLDTEIVPYRELLQISPAELGRRLAYMPWLLAVADPELYRARAYGSRGRFVPPEHAEIIGNLR